MANLSLKLLVDKKNNQVVFAESDKDFINILFSFLTMPMGTIIRLLGKKSGVGCLDKLYESVENLDTKYLQTDACKTMLLQPRGAAERKCEDLVVNMDNLGPRRMYRCPSWECYSKTHCLFSNVSGARCRCGKTMDKSIVWLKKNDVFVKGAVRFMISDDLNVTPISTGATLSLLQKLGIKDGHALEKRTVDCVGKDQILCLLKRMMISKTPLTDVFLRNVDLTTSNNETAKFDLFCTAQIKVESDATDEPKSISLRLLESRSMDKVVCAEAGEDLVDLLFSFLTFPLGSIVKILNKQSSLGCADYLYKSVEVLGTDGCEHMESEECKDMLLNPKLATHFGCSNQPLRIDETLFTTSTSHSCESCFKENHQLCKHGLKPVGITQINPKLPIPGTEHGGGFARRSVKFMVTNEMLVMPFSPISVIEAATEQQVPITSLAEREVTCREPDVLNLLKACLVSRSVLTNVFSHKKRKRLA